MTYDPGRRTITIGGVLVVGIGILYATEFWWPGIMFLIAIIAILEGWLNHDRLWYASQIGYWSAFVGLCALFGFNLVFLLVALGLDAILSSLISPGQISKPKPFVDSSLE